jgi:hypothetical protein
MKPASSKLTSASQTTIARRDGSPASWLPEQQCHHVSDSQPVVVLAVGFDPTLLKAQRSTQASRDYVIAAAESIKDAITCIHELNFDVVLLGQRLSVEDQQRLTFLVRSSGCRVPVICVTRSSGPTGNSSNGNIESTPETLLIGIAETLAEIAGKSPKADTARQPRSAETML